MPTDPTIGQPITAAWGASVARTDASLQNQITALQAQIADLGNKIATLQDDRRGAVAYSLTNQILNNGNGFKARINLDAVAFDSQSPYAMWAPGQHRLTVRQDGWYLLVGQVTYQYEINASRIYQARLKLDGFERFVGPLIHSSTTNMDTQGVTAHVIAPVYLFAQSYIELWAYARGYSASESAYTQVNDSVNGASATAIRNLLPDGNWTDALGNIRYDGYLYTYLAAHKLGAPSFTYGDQTGADPNP